VRRAVPWVAAPICVPVLWLLIASYVWCLGVQKPYEPLAWWHATPGFGINFWVTIWLIAGAALPTTFALIALVGAAQWWRLRGRVEPRLIVPRRSITAPRKSGQRPIKPIIRGITGNHGDSDWRSLEDTLKRFPPPVPGKSVMGIGEAYRVDYDYEIAGVEFDPQDKSTWGMGGKAPIFSDHCNAGARGWHSGVFAPTGSGKSSELVTRILLWLGSSIVYDPTIELGPLLDRALRKQRKKVYHIGIPDPTKPVRMTGFNVLSWIDPDHPEAELHVDRVIFWAYNEKAAAAASAAEGLGDHVFFSQMGKELATCLLAHLIWSDPEQIEISLATFAAGMSTPEDDMISLLHKIHANSPSHMARRIAGTFMQGKAAETFSGIYLNAVNGMKWLFRTAYADLLSLDGFDPRSLLLGNCTVFVNINLSVMQTQRAIGRVIMGALFNTIFMADGHTHGLIAAFIDEADTFKRLDAFETARDQGRHYKLVLHMLWQSLAQVRTTWNEDGMVTWLDSFSWAAYAGVRASGAGKKLQDDLGGYGALAFSEGNNQGQQQPFGLSFGTFSRGQNVNVHEISHRLITAPELQQTLRADEQIVVPDTGMPIRCGRCYWFRRSKIVELLAQ